MTTFHLKRIYEDAAPEDGYRVLVDRLWPRGVSKEHAALDEWCKDVTPSPELRTWFGHRPERYAEFSQRYRHELDQSGAVQVFVQRLAKQPTVTLLIAAADPVHNHGLVLIKEIESYTNQL
ncbi:MAG: DUF488 domain-containing protein [Actinomycetaceae bacterium]|nr:DUF488 domain-containing protein [Actinomycetaceae bacterium]